MPLKKPILKILLVISLVLVVYSFFSFYEKMGMRIQNSNDEAYKREDLFALKRDIEQVARQSVEKAHSLAQHPGLASALSRADRLELQKIADLSVVNSRDFGLDVVAFFDKDGRLVTTNAVDRYGRPIAKAKIERVFATDFSQKDVIQDCLKDMSHRAFVEFQTRCDFTPLCIDASGLSLAVSLPVIDASTKELVGVINVHRDFDRISNLISGSYSQRLLGEVYLVSDEGEYFSDEVNSGILKPPVVSNQIQFLLQSVPSAASPVRSFKQGGYTLDFIALNIENSLPGKKMYIFIKSSKQWTETINARRLASQGFLASVLLALVVGTFYSYFKRKRFFRTKDSSLEYAADTGLAKMSDRRKVFALPLLVLGGFLLMTLFAWEYVRKTVEQHEQAEFRSSIREIRNKVVNEIDVYSQVLYGVRALFAASGNVERDEWRTYARTLDVKNRYPGMVALCFIKKVLPEEVEAYVKNVREDRSVLASGYPGFKIRPIGDRDQYFVVTYAEPYEGNEHTLGFDMAENPSSRAVFEQVKDSGVLAAIDLVDISTGGNGDKGIVLFLPIYKKGASAESREQRRANHVGFVSATINPKDLFSDIFKNPYILKGVFCQVYSSDLIQGPTQKGQLTRSSLIYQNSDQIPAAHNPGSLNFSDVLTIDVAGRIWTLSFSAGPDFHYDTADEVLPWFVLFGGLIISLLVSGTFYLSINTGARAVSIAREITRDLRESQERISVLMSQAPDPILNLDIMGFIKEVNPAVEKVSGYPPEYLVGKHFIQTGVLVGESIKMATQEFLAAVSGKERPPFELTMKKKDQSTFFMEVHAQLIKLEKNSFVQLIMRDVTERNKADKELRQLTIAVEQSPASIVMTDVQGNIQYVNKKFEEASGYSSAEVMGKNPRILKSGHTSPEEYKKLWEAITSGHEWRGEFHNKRKDGTLYWEAAAIVPVLSSAGKIINFLAIKGDITERKKAEEASRESENKLRNITNAILGTVYQYHVTKEGKESFQFISEGSRELFGLEPDAMIKDYKMIWRLVLPEDKNALRIVIQGATPAMKSWVHDFRVQKSDGAIKWIRGSAVPQLVPSDGSIIWNGIFIEVTEQKKIEAQLLQVQKMETVGTLAGGIAHDLNNQLTPVKGYLDLLLNQTDPGHPSHHLLSEASQSAERCAEVIQRLMNFSRSSGQKRTILLPAQVLNELKVLLNNFLPSNIRVSVDCAENIWPVEGNETEFQTVLMNLVINARDAMPDGGELSLKAENVNFDADTAKPGRGVGPHLMIAVKDTGIGMPPEVLSHIFEPFYTTKKKGQGTGLGLAMVFKTVKGHGGWIDVSSEVGKGSVFQVYFPAKPNAAVVSTDAGAGILNDFLANGETILFADDEEAIRYLGKVFLEKLGYKVLLASDGAEVITLYEKNYPTIDALVLDMTMPQLTGRQMLARVLAINPSAKVIIVSGYTSEGGPKELMEMGAREFLQKPYTIFPLGKIIKSVLTSNH